MLSSVRLCVKLVGLPAYGVLGSPVLVGARQSTEDRSFYNAPAVQGALAV
jgi:hypothetical protein